METFSALLAICAGNSPVSKGAWLQSSKDNADVEAPLHIGYIAFTAYLSAVIRCKKTLRGLFNGTQHTWIIYKRLAYKCLRLLIDTMIYSVLWILHPVILKVTLIKAQYLWSVLKQGITISEIGIPCFKIHHKYGTHTVKNNVTDKCVVVLSAKCTLHYICRFQILSAIILVFTKMAFIGR